MAAAPYRYRYATLQQLGTPDCSAVKQDWLGRDEQRTYCGLRDPRRRRCWLAGRLLAKQLILEKLRAEQPGLRYLGFEVATLAELEQGVEDLQKRGIEVAEGSKPELAQRGVAGLALLHDPAGHRLELFSGPLRDRGVDRKSTRRNSSN